jgi:hypothetical protein
MKIRIVILGGMILLLCACGSISAEISQSSIDTSVAQAVLVATTGNTNVFRFISPEGNACYITENTVMRTASSIWCSS